MGLNKKWKGAAAALTALGLAGSLVPAWAGTRLIFDSQSGKRVAPSNADPDDERPGPKPLVAPQDNEDATELHPSVSSNHTPAEAQPGDVVYADAEEPTGPQPRVQVIMDGSGSMAEELEGEKTKMYFAKKLLSKYLIQQWKEKAEVSLRVYGARRTKDCADIYRAVPFRARSLDEIARKVAVVEPTGKTPIAESMKAAYDDLKSYKGPKRIVLFTDGQETCGGDPCELVKKFDIDKEVDMKIYVVAIGMDPNSDEAKGLSCLGNVQFAQDSSDMEGDLGNISKQLSKHNNLFVDNPDPSAGVTVFRILDNGDRVPFRGFTAAFGTNVPPGKYAAEVRVDPPFEFREFYVPPHKTVTLKVRGKGLLEVKFVKALASIEVVDKDDKLVYRLESERPYYIDSGKYKLRVLAPPFFRRDIRKYYIYPNGEYYIDMKKDAGVVQLMHPATRGLYVFSNDRMLGNYVTNVPFVLPNGTYRVFLDKECDIRKVQVGESLNVKNVRCSGEDETPKNKKPSLR